MTEFLLPHQHKGQRELRDIYGSGKRVALLADDTGVGKTFQAWVYAKEQGMNVFVITPKPVIPNWFSVAEYIGYDMNNFLGISNYELIKNGKYYTSIAAALSEDKQVCPYLEMENNEYNFTFPPHTLFILDEAHRGKNNGTGNHKFMMSAYRSISLIPSCKILIVSATISDKLECMAFLCYMLGICTNTAASYRVYKTRCGRGIDVSPGSTIDAEIIKNMHRDIFPAYGTRTLITAVEGYNINENEKICKVFPIDPETENEIEACYEDIRVALERVRLKQITAFYYLVILLRARQRIETLKVAIFVRLIRFMFGFPLINDMYDDRELDDAPYAWSDPSKKDSVVIFVNFTETINLILTELSKIPEMEEILKNVSEIVGGQKPGERENIRLQFQRGESRLILCNIKAGGVGLSLHDLVGDRPRRVYSSNTWSVIDIQQVFGRVDRVGGKSPTMQRIVYCSGKVKPIVEGGPNGNCEFLSEDAKKPVGIEVFIAATCNKKMKNLTMLNDGDLIGVFLQDID